jgi:ketosteroid isomerase-like protein
MRAATSLVLILAIVLSVGCASTSDSATPDSGMTPEQQSVLDALHAFYAAEIKLFQGEMAPMEGVWSRRPDITYLSPSGRFNVGWDEVMADWRTQAQQHLGGTIEPRDIHVFVQEGCGLAVAQNLEVASGQVIDGRPADITIRATNVFRKEHGRWKMVSHATDVIPNLEGHE